VALLDYTLPGWDSRTALTQLLAACPDMPVISVAGTIGEETAVEMLKLGAADFVAKDRLARLRSWCSASSRRRRSDAHAWPLRWRCARARRATGVSSRRRGGHRHRRHGLRHRLQQRAYGDHAGYAADEMIGMTLADLQLPDDPGFRSAQERLRRAGEPSQYQRRFRRADGGGLW